MKNLRLLMFAAVGCLAVTACSSDDDSDGNNNVSADLEGTYELTAVNTPNEQDYDGDGDSSTNLATEGNCYNDSWISFHEDGTYDESFTSSTMADGGLTLECNTQVSSGTYTRNGDNVTTTRTSGTGSATMSFTFNSSSHTLTRNQSNATYSGWNAASSLWANLTGNLQLTYEKYTDNDDDNGNGQDDDNNTDTDAVARLVGDFNLSALIVGSAQDLDDDGDSSTNLATESNCYSDSQITFHSDGTYEETRTHNILGAGGLSLSCDTETTTGTWTRNGDNIVTRHSSGNFNVNTQYMFDSQAHTISRDEDNYQFPSFSSVTNLFTMLSGSASYEYERN